jgi:peptide deformylase
MTKVRPLVMLGNEILRREAVSFAPVGGSEAKQVVEELFATAAANSDSNAVGLAAPQVRASICTMRHSKTPTSLHTLQIGSSTRAFLMMDQDKTIQLAEQGNAEVAFRAILNPAIIGSSEEIKEDWESCLSVPGLIGVVPRAESIKV